MQKARELRELLVLPLIHVILTDLSAWGQNYSSGKKFNLSTNYAPLLIKRKQCYDIKLIIIAL